MPHAIPTSQRRKSSNDRKNDLIRRLVDMARSLVMSEREERPSPADALDWVLLREVAPLTATEEASFQAWLAADSANPGAYDEALRRQQIGRLARAAIGPAPDIALVTKFPGATVHAPGPARSRRWLFGGVGALAASIAIGAIVVPSLLGETYRTVVGERRMVTLSDGSTVHLNGATEIRVRFSDALRRIELGDGEALFEVAHNPARPLEVQVRDRIVRAVGTGFNIDIQASAISVAVTDGTVAVLPAATSAHGAADAVRVEKGFGVSYAPKRAPGAVHPVAIDQIGAWRRDVLIFDDLPFEDILVALRRRYPGSFAIADARFASRRFSGTVTMRDRDQTIQNFARALRIQVQQTGPDQFLFAASTKSGN
jgi:transmembrane sensor